MRMEDYLNESLFPKTSEGFNKLTIRQVRKAIQKIVGKEGSFLDRQAVILSVKKHRLKLAIEENEKIKNLIRDIENKLSEVEKELETSAEPKIIKKRDALMKKYSLFLNKHDQDEDAIRREKELIKRLESNGQPTQ